MDIDAVSIATYAIDNNGLLPLWSPYAIRKSLSSINDSMELPFPTGIKVIRTASANDEEGKKAQRILISNLFKKYVGEGKLFTIVGDKLLLHNDPELLLLLKEFLEETKEIPELNASDQNKLATTLGIDKKAISKMLDFIAKVVDRHNMFISRKRPKEIEMIACNHAQYLMQSIIKDVINLPQSLSSVDANTGPLKDVGDGKVEGIESADAELVKHRAPGNAYNKYESIRENQVGKDGIAICATGLKGFFAASQAYNTILNGNYSDADKESVLFNKGILIVLNDGSVKTFYHLANLNSPTLINYLENLLDLVDLDSDAALILSAMLSLATDNAKELQLSKLNAGTKTIGMYLYGISIGMEFKDIAGLMMSPLGKAITSLMDAGNVFLGTKGASSVSDVINCLYKGPKYQTSQFLTSDEDSKITVASTFEESLKLVYTGHPNCKSLNSLMAVLAWDGKRTLELKLSIIQQLTVPGGSQHSTNFLLQFEQLKESMSEYVKLVHLFTSDSGTNVRKELPQFESLKTLSDGAEEMRILGSILSLNLGLSTKEQEIIDKILTILNVVIDRYNSSIADSERKRYLNWISSSKQSRFNSSKIPDLEFSLTEFCFGTDLQKQAIIDSYEQYKHSINILKCVQVVPNFSGYLQTLALLDGCLTVSSGKYRAIKSISDMMIDHIGAISKKHKEFVIKGVSDAYNDFVINHWMLEKGITLRQVIDPDNYNEKIDIELGTNYGNANFKKLMETVIIPRLLQHPIIGLNQFIHYLRRSILTKTVSRNPVTYYALPINMLPSDPSERAIFEQYKALLNLLEGVVEPITGMPLIDLLSLYGLIAHYGKQGLQSLMPIFEDLHRTGYLQSFHLFESEFGLNGTWSLNNEVTIELLEVYCTPKDNPYISNLEILYYQDPDFLETKLYRKVRQKSSDYDENIPITDGRIGDYVPQKSNFKHSVYNMYGNVYFNSYEYSDLLDINIQNLQKILLNLNEMIGSVSLSIVDGKYPDILINTFDSISGLPVRSLSVLNMPNISNEAKEALRKVVTTRTKDGDITPNLSYYTMILRSELEPDPCK